MYLVAIFVVAACVLIFGLVRMQQLRRHRELEAHSMDVDRLHALLESKQEIEDKSLAEVLRQLSSQS